jgi:hypothetical protein
MPAAHMTARPPSLFWLMPCSRQTPITFSPDSASRKTHKIYSSLCRRLAILLFSSHFQRTAKDRFFSISRWLSFWVTAEQSVVLRVGNTISRKSDAWPLWFKVGSPYPLLSILPVPRADARD